MPKKSQPEAEEFFYRDKDGKRQDAELHEPILAEGDDAAAQTVSKKVMRRLGYNDDEIEALFDPAAAKQKLLAQTRAQARALLARLKTRARDDGEHEEETEQTEVELWPEEGEKRSEFMDRCTIELEKCIGDRAEEVCDEKWHQSRTLGTKGFVTVKLTGNLAIESCGETCVCGGDKASTNWPALDNRGNRPSGNASDGLYKPRHGREDTNDDPRRDAGAAREAAERAQAARPRANRRPDRPASGSDRGGSDRALLRDGRIEPVGDRSARDARTVEPAIPPAAAFEATHLAEIVSAIRGFDPDEPRDEQGRWTSGGSASDYESSGTPPSKAETDTHVSAVYKLNAKGEEAAKKADRTPLTFHALTPDGNERFHAAITAAKSALKFGASVHAYEPGEYRDTKMFVTPDNQTGFVVKSDGDIASAFSRAKVDRAGDSILALAVQQGGRKLDAFDTVLPGLYSRNGFRAVARLAWNDQYAPDGWDKATFAKFNKGEPDVVFMVYDPEHAQPYKAGDGKRVTSYDEGVAAQSEALKK